MIPYTPFRIALLLTATGVSLAFLLRNLYPVITTSTNLSARLLVVIVGVLQVALSLGLWFGFMASGGGKFNNGAGSTLPLPGGAGDDEPVLAQLFR